MLSGLPGSLTVAKVRELFEGYGIDRVYLEPRTSGGKSRSYSEGWVEFLDRRIARSCALSLNGTAIGKG